MSVDQVKERAEAGDAWAQTRVIENTCTQIGTEHCSQSCWLCTCVYFWLFGRRSEVFNMTQVNILTHTNH